MNVDMEKRINISKLHIIHSLQSVRNVISKRKIGANKEEVRMKFTRKELTELEDRAVENSKIPNQNPLWTRAYLRLADALNCLDAMRARLAPQAKWCGVDKKGK